MIARRIVHAHALALILAVAGCSTESATSDLTATRAEVSAPAQHAAFAKIGINRFATESDAAIVGDVLSVSEPRWNSMTGEPWRRDPEALGRTATPLQYRDSTVSVERVLYESDELPVQRGSNVTVRLYGSGDTTGTEVDGLGYSATFDQISGPLLVGSRVLLVLKREVFGMQGPSEEWPMVNRLMNHFQGNWRIEGQRAVNADPKRTVADVEELIRALIEERERGPRPYDAERERATRDNPLG